MFSLIQILLAFTLVITILVSVHEFGHYWVAKRLGVKVLRFSIGFGKALWSYRFGKDKTEFVIAAIPLGGYVKMLDEREGEVAAEEKHRAFNQQVLWKRTAIVVAGPLFNFLLAIIVYTMMYMNGVTGMQALVGDVTPESIAEQAGFQSGYQIIAVNQQATTRWANVVEESLQVLLDGPTEIIYSVRTEQNHHYDLTVNVYEMTLDDVAQGHFLKKLGISPLRPTMPAVLSEVLPNSTAERAGLKSGDKVMSFDEQPIQNWQEMGHYISTHPGQEILAEIEHNNQRLHITLTPSDIEGEGKIGVKLLIPEDYYDKYLVTEHYGFGQAFLRSLEKTWDISLLTLRMIGKMITAEISSKNISGPITIAKFSGLAVERGLSVFLSFLGLISVSLGVINLLPIPLLDGGHLFFYLIERIKGSPVSEKTEVIFQKVGMTLLLLLMGLAIFNDFERLFFN